MEVQPGPFADAGCLKKPKAQQREARDVLQMFEKLPVLYKQYILPSAVAKGAVNFLGFPSAAPRTHLGLTIVSNKKNVSAGQARDARAIDERFDEDAKKALAAAAISAGSRTKVVEEGRQLIEFVCVSMKFELNLNCIELK